MIDFMGKHLSNPLIASSCIATENVQNILRLAGNGVQGAILKSCADYKRKNASGKRHFAVDKKGYTYASSPFEKEILTLDECMEIMRELRPQTDILLIPSITASDISSDEWIPACRQLQNLGADGIQLDFFYMGSLIGHEGFSEKLESMLRELVETLDVPVMPKLNINLPRDYILPLIARAGVEYVSLLDSVRSPYFEKKDGKYCVSERLDAETTSCFGGWQLPLTLGYTYSAAKLGLNVCAGGGVTGADDIRKLLAAGAVTVQSATFLTKYPERAHELIS